MQDLFDAIWKSIFDTTSDELIRKQSGCLLALRVFLVLIVILALSSAAFGFARPHGWWFALGAAVLLVVTEAVIRYTDRAGE